MTVSNDEYDAGTFRSLADTDLGRDLWQFLNKELTVARLETATDLAKPAVFGIEEQLLERFGNVVANDRVKQMIGHMVRQIMESKGYRIERRDVTIGSALFSKGTRYGRPDWQRLQVFRNGSNARELCFADSRDTDKLPPPADGGRWRFWASFASVLRGQIAYGIDVYEVRQEVAAQGHALRTLERITRPT